MLPTSTAPIPFVIASGGTWSAGHALLLGLAVIALAIAGWSSWRRGIESRRGSKGHTCPLSEQHTQESSIPTPQPSPAVAATDVGTADEMSSDEELFFSSTASAAFRRCPECHRTFPAAFDVCPFDTSVLEETSSISSPDNPRRNGVIRRYCGDCGRRYEGSVRHCPHDGQRLRRDSPSAREDAPTFRICTHCGWQSDDHTVDLCPRDGRPLAQIDPGDKSHHPQPPILFYRCRQCGHIASPGQIRCPNDDAVLLPASSATPRAMPATGSGVRRRICPDCGTKFDDQCRYCSLDGTKLVALN